MKPAFSLVMALCAAPAFLLAVPAMAQTSALKGLDTSGPIDFDAAHLEVLDAQNQALLSGNVVIRQGKLTLNADRVKLLYTKNSSGDPEIDRLDARGNVKLVSPSERAAGNTGIYDVSARIITLIGDVTLDRGGSLLKGQRLVLNLNSGLTSFDGGGGGTAQPGATTGRVTGRLLVPQRKADSKPPQ
jgi:lipopolysaccharide export system protein LptA